ncbi:MAG: type II toxin-antitoxin system RelE/ParE family toxin [Pyramidobacter sp.]|nr:type II toxin-antitoxin system RelE/ParE family toxin [Pyramidobacter sp.]
MSRIFKVRLFTRWAESENISDTVLCRAVEELESGLFDANLGGNLYKKRIPHSGRGKRGGARTIIATRFEERVFFMAGFAKNVQENIERSRLEALKEYAKLLLRYSDTEIDRAVSTRNIREVICDGR